MYDSYRTSKKESLEEIHHLVDSSQTIKNNTFKVYYKDGSIAIRLHWTDVITFYKDKVKLNAGSWQSHTTKSRINEHLPCGRVVQEKHIWYVCGSNGKFLFVNGIMLDYNGYILSIDGDILWEGRDIIIEED